MFTPITPVTLPVGAYVVGAIDPSETPHFGDEAHVFGGLSSVATQILFGGGGGVDAPTLKQFFAESQLIAVVGDPWSVMEERAVPISKRRPAPRIGCP